MSAPLVAYRDRTQSYLATVTSGTPPVPFPLGGARLVFTASVRPQDSPPLIQKDNAGLGGIVITDPPNGLAVITLQPSDTNGLSDQFPSFLAWDLAAIVGSNTYPLASGTLSVLQNVGQL